MEGGINPFGELKYHWLPPERLGIVEWIEKYYKILPNLNAEPGPYKFSRTPFFRGIAQAVVDKTIEEISLLKSVQMGFSEFERAILCYLIDQQPGPTLLVMPGETNAQEIMDERIKPAIMECPQVKRHVIPPYKENFTNAFIRFDSMQLYTGWSGSIQSLATRPIRYALLDEVDNYTLTKDFSDPVRQTRRRTTTFLESKLIVGSTPSVKTKPIWQSFINSNDQRCYLVPCPHCQHYQRLVWTQIKFATYIINDGKETNPLDQFATHKEKAVYVEQNNTAYYECEQCKGHITHQHKNHMINAGVWVSGKVDEEGNWIQTHEIGKYPKVKKVGFWINTLYALIGKYASWSKCVADFLNAQGNEKALQDFHNNLMAEPFEELIRAIRSDDIRALQVNSSPAGIVPSWGQMLFLSADVMKNGNSIYWVLRAWGAGFKSRLIDFGITSSFEKLMEMLKNHYPIEGSPYVKPVDLLFIDCGYKPELVYELARKDSRVKPIEGMKGKQKGIIAPTQLKEYNTERLDINTQHFKDMRADQQEFGIWEVNNTITNDYCQQLASEQKMWDNDAERMMWKQIHAENHYLDCEVYQVAAALKYGAGNLTDNLPIPTQPQPQQIQRQSFSLSL